MLELEGGVFQKSVVLCENLSGHCDSRLVKNSEKVEISIGKR